MVSSHSWQNANQGRSRSSGLVTVHSPRPILVNSCTVTHNNLFIMMAILWVFKACSVFGSDVSEKKVRLQAHRVHVKLSLCTPGEHMGE